MHCDWLTGSSKQVSSLLTLHTFQISNIFMQLPSELSDWGVCSITLQVTGQSEEKKNFAENKLITWCQQCGKLIHLCFLSVVLQWSVYFTFRGGWGQKSVLHSPVVQWTLCIASCWVSQAPGVACSAVWIQAEGSSLHVFSQPHVRAYELYWFLGWCSEVQITE